MASALLSQKLCLRLDMGEFMITKVGRESPRF